MVNVVKNLESFMFLYEAVVWVQSQGYMQLYLVMFALGVVTHWGGAAAVSLPRKAACRVIDGASLVFDLLSCQQGHSTYVVTESNLLLLLFWMRKRELETLRSIARGRKHHHEGRTLSHRVWRTVFSTNLGMLLLRVGLGSPTLRTQPTGFRY
jgi:antitoxin component of MazEF toxin-antitoxin module